MGLETATSIAALNASWPLGTDLKSQGDDHLRLIKRVLQSDVVPKGGGTYTGAVVFPQTAGAPAVQFGSAGYGIQRSNGAAPASERLVFQLNGATVAAVELGGVLGGSPSLVSLVTVEKGDARYVRSGGSTLTGPVVLPLGDGTTAVLGFGSNGAGFVRPSNPTQTDRLYVLSGGATAAIFEPGGTAAPSALSILTKEKGAALFAPISSARRWKDQVAAPEPVDLGALERRGWIWSDELGEGDPRVGRPGSGLIAEEVEPWLPEAVVKDAEGTVLGLDPLSLIGALVEGLQALSARVDALETAAAA